MIKQRVEEGVKKSRPEVFLGGVERIKHNNMMQHVI